MKKRYILAALLFGASLTMPAYTQTYDKLTKKMLETYASLIEQDPQDYKSYFERGMIYAQLGLVDDALTDFGKALQFTPKKEADYAVNVLTSMSDLHASVGNNEKALEAIEKAIELEPNSYVNRYKKGNILLTLNRPDEALGVFRGLQTLKSRSQEAYYGMARCYIVQNNLVEVDDLIKEIEQADPSNYNTYLRIGDLYMDMGRHEDAAANYLSSFALSKNSSAPIEALYKVASIDYDAFERAVDYAIGRSPNKMPLYYIKGNIAYNAGKYDSAINAMNNVLQSNGGEDSSVYSVIARSQLSLGKLEDAKAAIEKAIALELNAKNYLIKAEIELALNNPAASLIAANKASDIKETNDAYIAQALAQMALNNNETAINSLNEAVMNDPGDVLPLMIRGYLNTQLGNKSLANIDYERASNVDGDSFPVIAYKAIAKNNIGKKLDAVSMIEKALKENPSKEGYYYAAIYYAQTGNVEKGKEMLERAVALGYNNNYNLKINNKANLTVAPLR